MSSVDRRPDRRLLFATLVRGLRMRCPRCGQGRLFTRAYRLRDACRACGLAYARYADDTWAMMYLSTAGLTGVVVVIMILVRPANLLLGRVGVVAIALTLIVASLPVRKGIAIAINWLVGLGSTEAAGAGENPGRYD
jgi:uncharacterized protein (DUF983 family)